MPRDPEADAPLAPLYVIAGPTAVGKSEIALDIAQTFGMEIVLCDSRVVYRRLDIGTAKADEGARARVPHHMLDLVDPRDAYDAARYAADAAAVIDGIRARGNLPLVEGGTGFYLRSLLLASGLDGPGADPGFRRAILEEAAAHPPGWLHAELRRVDPASAARLHAADTFRVVRALEITRATGRPASETRTGLDPSRMRYDARVVAVTRPRPELDRRIDTRWRGMLARGLLDEVRELAADGIVPPLVSLRAPGYRELFEHLAGRMRLEEAGEAAVRATRRFAKRQLTWFRHQAPGACRVDLGRGVREDTERVMRGLFGDGPPR